ncbi:MAG TPA: RcnB family protein [Stenotrophomonas sp.]|nr:RcnB family protein [Stenotrophomonas sp.]
MNRIAASLLTLSLLATAGTALAEPPPHAGNPHGHKGKGMPPGQAKKHWKQGEFLPADYRGVYVEDYHHHGLRAPPPGHQWRRVDDQYVLIAVATGIITSVILANN